MGQYKKLFSNTLVMALGQFSSKLLSFLLVPLYTSILSTEQYGTYDLVLTTVTLLTPFLTLIISEAVMRFCMDRAEDPNHVLSIGLLLTLGGSLILGAAYPFLSRIEALGSTNTLWLIALFVATNLYTVLTQFLKGIERVRFYAAAGILSTVLALTMNILFLVVLDMSITGYFLATVLSHLLASAVIAVGIGLPRRLVNPLRIPRETYRRMLRFSIPMIPNSISWWISNSSSKYLLLYFSSAAVVGVYSVAYKIPSILTIVVTIFVSAFQISIFESFGKEESHGFFGNVYAAFASLNVVAASFLIALSKMLAHVLYQKEFFAAWNVSCIIIFAYVFNSLAALIGTVYSASKKTKFLFYSTLVGALLNVVLALALIPWIGMHGAAIATLISYVAVWLLRVVDIKRRYGYDFHLILSLLSSLLIVGQIVLMYLDRWWSLPASLLVFVLILVVNLRSILRSDLIRGVLEKVLRRIKRG